MDWLTDELKIKVRKVFEPRYGKTLSDLEIEDIAENLVGFIEGIANDTVNGVRIESEGQA